jgi:tetratricopeptide (TPR) repeat protein
LAIFESIGDLKGKSATLHQLASLDAQQGRVEQARVRYEESLAIKESIGDLKGKSATLHQLAILDAQQGRVEQARARYEESLALKISIGNIYGAAFTLVNLGQIDAQNGDFGSALAALQHAEEIFTRLGAPEAEQVREIAGQVQFMAITQQLGEAKTAQLMELLQSGNQEAVNAFLAEHLELDA